MRLFFVESGYLDQVHWRLVLGFLGVVVKTSSRLPAVETCQHHSLQQRWRGEALLAKFVEHDFGDVIRRVEADEISQRKRSHRIATPELHCVIDVHDRSNTFLQRSNR